MPNISITPYQKECFKKVIEFVSQKPSFLGKRVTQSDAFELLLELFETAGMVPGS